ncbi:hypothetical protein GCM10020219_000660 [Nonomuraea dietziae]
MALATVLEAWTTFRTPGHLDVEVILMAYWPTPPRSERLSRQTFPHPFRNAGVVEGLCVSYPLARVPGAVKVPVLPSIR